MLFYFRCEQCNKKFREPKALRKHYKMSHQRSNNKQCPCGKEFITPNEVRTHKFTCPVYQTEKAKTFPTEAPQLSEKEILLKQNEMVKQKPDQAVLHIVQEEGGSVLFSLNDGTPVPEMNHDSVESIVRNISEELVSENMEVSTDVVSSSRMVEYSSIPEELASSVETSNVTVDPTDDALDSNYMCGFCYQMYNSVQEVEQHMHLNHPQELGTGQVELELSQTQS